MMKRWLGLLLLSFCLAMTAPACKKKGEEVGGDAVAEEEDDSEGKKKKKKKKKKRKGKKGKKKKAAKEEKKGSTDPEKEVGEAAKSLVPSPPAGAGDKPAGGDRAEARARKVDAGSPGDPPTKPADRGSARHEARGVTPPPVKVSATKYVSVADITQRLPEKGWVSYGPIPGIVPGGSYNSVIYRRPGTNRFVSAQVWDFGTYAEAVEKWNEQLGTYPNAQEQKEMFSDLVFFSYRNQTTNLTFVEPDHAIVISVTCHTESCDDTSLYELAKTAYIRAH